MSRSTLTMTESLQHYLLSTGLREQSVLAELREYTSHHPFRDMQISPEQGQLMAMLVRLTGAKRTIEIGVFTGYSTLSVALALPDDGKIIACDIDDETTAIARQYWMKAGVDHKIELRVAPANQTLQSLINAPDTNPVDMAFIDADKVNYDLYYEQCLELVRPGGLILIDNTLWGGKVADEHCMDEDTVAIRQLNQKIVGDQRVDMMMLPVSDGLSMIMKRTND